MELDQDDGEMTAEQRRRVEGLSDEELRLLDEALLREIGHRWRKLARVVARGLNAVNERVPNIPDVFAASRVRRMVSLGAVTSQGNLFRMRFSEVRLPDPQGDDEADEDIAEPEAARRRDDDLAALQQAEAYVAAHPDELGGWLKLGSACSRAGDPTRTAEVGAAARGRFGDDLQLLFFLGRWHARAGQFSRAIAVFDDLEATASHEHWNSLRDATCLFRGYCRVRSGRSAEAAVDVEACKDEGDVYFCGERISRAWIEARVRAAL